VPRVQGTDVSTAGLALSALFVLASVLIIPAWRNKHAAGINAAAVLGLSYAALGAAAAATGWLTWQVVSLGVHDTPEQSHHQFLGSILGVPVIVIPLAVLVAVVGVTELVARTSGASPVPSPTPSSHAAAARGSMERRSPELRPEFPRDLPTPRQRKIGQRVMNGSRDLLGYFNRAEQRTVEAIRGEVAAGGAHSRTTLADAISQIESRLSVGLEQHARVQTSTQDAVGRLQETVTDSAATVTRALEGVSEVCARVADQIEAHRLERHLLTDAVALLARPVSRPRDVPPRTIVAEPEISIVEDDERAPDPVPTTVTYERWRDPANQTTAVRSSVKRLRERAQQAGRQMWTRARANRSGFTPPD
jgi:hypothetical protein